MKVSGHVVVGLAGLAALCAGAALLIHNSAGTDGASAQTETAPVVAVPAAAPVACPAGSPEFGPARPGTAETMVPDSPLSADVCRYEKAGGDFGSAPSTPPPLTLSGRLEGAELVAVVDAFNAGGPGNPRLCGIGIVGAPATIVWTTFHYAAGPAVNVTWWGTGPCNQSHNGTKTDGGLAHEIPPYWTDPVPPQQG